MAEEVLFQMEKEARDASRRSALLSAPRRRNSSGSDLSVNEAGKGDAMFHFCVGLLGKQHCTTDVFARARLVPIGVHIMCDGFVLGSAVGLQASYTNGNGSATPAAVQWDGRRLYWFEEAPPVLQFNKYVRSGYRAGLNYQQCLCSIFSYHNETGVVLDCPLHIFL